MLETIIIGGAIAALWLLIYSMFHQRVNGTFMTWWLLTIVPCSIIIALALRTLGAV